MCEAGEENYPSTGIISHCPWRYDLEQGGEEEKKKKKKGTYCNAGALCKPPSNLAGKIEKDAFPPTRPRLRASDPEVPAVEDRWKPGSSAQHSRVEWLF